MTRFLMKLIVKITKSAPREWNNFVKKVAGTIYQSTYWRNMMSQYNKAQPYFLTVYKNSCITGGLLFFKQAKYQDLLTKRPFSTITSRLGGLFGKHINFIGGPMIIDEPTAVNKLIDCALLDFILKNNIRSLCGSSHFKNKFESRLAHTRWSTFIVDLDKPANELWSGLSKNLRKNIRRTKNKGVVVSCANELVDLKVYCKLLLAQKDILSKLHYRKFLKNIKTMQNTLSGSYFRIFIARLKGHPISGLIVHGFGTTANEVGVARSRFEKRRKIYAQDLIKWSAILDSKKKGFKYFDLAGAAHKPRNLREKGIKTYKKKWGGIEHVYYRFFK